MKKLLASEWARWIFNAIVIVCLWAVTVGAYKNQLEQNTTDIKEMKGERKLDRETLIQIRTDTAWLVKRHEQEDARRKEP